METLEQVTVGRVVVALALTAALGSLGFVYRLFQRRMTFYRLKTQGFPMPSWNPISGHLQTLFEGLKQLPKGSQVTDVFTLLSSDFPTTDHSFYIDVWPFGNPLLVVTCPDLAIQACQEHDLPKPPIPFVTPFAGGPSLFVTNGPEWRRSRALFNPAYSATAMLEHAPHIVTEAEVYVEKLREHAKKGDTFSLDDMTCDYMMDVIGVVTINTRLNSQRGYNELASAMRSSIRWHILVEETNPLIFLNPMRPIIQRYNGYKMNRYIHAELDKRYEEWKYNNKSTTRTRSVMDLVIAEYMNKKKAVEKLDMQFKRWATIQIRLFLFAGHDSTAATIVYALYLLSKNPDALEKIRAEHDEVFGSDLSSTTQILKERPTLINQLPYTTAVIKEALRLFPPASGMRRGQPNVILRDSHGNTFPTEGLHVWIDHSALHRNPDYWPNPHSFIPERWLVKPDHPLYPPKGAWRPFEFGSRNCVGQALAMLDIKITLVMTAREFDFKDQYAEWDRLHPPKGVKTVFGERAYQISQGASHPADGFPCRVTLRGNTKPS